MTDEIRFDAVLADLIAPDGVELEPDFAAQTMQLIAAYEALKVQRRRMVREWLWQMAALAALVIGLTLFSQLPVVAALPRAGILAIASPLTLVIGLWLYGSGVFDITGTIPGTNLRRPHPAG